MRVLTIGRSADNDVPVADDSVQPRHAELVITEEGRAYLHDCGGNATWRQDGEGAWQAVRQQFIEPDDRLRFGEFVTHLSDLLRRADRPQGLTPRAGQVGAERLVPSALRGRVERDPTTGELIRRRG